MKDMLYPQNDLFAVEGELVNRYNNALEMVVGKRTELESFYVDKRGESMELEGELGKNYLQNGPSNRYAIIVSPSQYNSPLVHEEFSFDNQLLDFLYENHGSEIGVVTRVDSLVGELDDSLRSINSVEDLSLLHRMYCSLDTPSNFLDKARNLQKAVVELENNPHLLTKNNSLHIRKIQSLVREVGDVRGYNFHEISVSKEIGSFYTRLFEGTYVFRNDSSPISIHAPGTMDVNDCLSSGKEITTIIHSGDQKIESNEFIQFYQSQNKMEVLKFLFKNQFGVLNFKKIEDRLLSIEDHFLLGLNLDVVDMPVHDRKRLLAKHQNDLPEIWNELHKTDSALSHGYDNQSLANDLSSEAWALLIEPSEGCTADKGLINNLITKLNRSDYKRMVTHNLRDLEHIYSKSDGFTKKYIAAKIKR